MTEKIVGSSWRSPGKHHMMNRVGGGEAGAASQMRGVRKSVWLDLNAGSGVPASGDSWEHGTSTGILARHAAWACNAGLDVYVIACEIAIETYRTLLMSLDDGLARLGYERETETSWSMTTPRASARFVARCQDSRDLSLSQLDPLVSWVDGHTAVLALSDPNSMSDWALRDGFCSEVRERATLFRLMCTMGCNPGGLKRLAESERQPWYDRLYSLADHLPAYHDILLARIINDDAQWAYSFVEPIKWRDRREQEIRKAFDQIERDAELTWLRTDPEGFRAQADVLFATIEERRRDGKAI